MFPADKKESVFCFTDGAGDSIIFAVRQADIKAGQTRILCPELCLSVELYSRFTAGIGKYLYIL